MSKLLEITGISVISCAIAFWFRWEAGVLFAGVALVFVGSNTDDATASAALRRGFARARYTWWRQVARENGIPLPRFRQQSGMVPCECGGNPDCPACEGTGKVPDPSLRVNAKSPHPPIRVDPQAEEFWKRMALARQERAKIHDATPSLRKHEYENGHLDRIA